MPGIQADSLDHVALWVGNTRAVLVRGPDGIMIEYVEHKFGFYLS